MRSERLGKNTSDIDLSISRFGIWLLVYNTEYFLSYKDYPWFRQAKISDVYNVQLLHKNHLHWPALDIDLDLDSLINPEKYPLVYYK